MEDPHFTPPFGVLGHIYHCTILRIVLYLNHDSFVSCHSCGSPCLYKARMIASRTSYTADHCQRLALDLVSFELPSVSRLRLSLRTTTYNSHKSFIRCPAPRTLPSRGIPTRQRRDEPHSSPTRFTSTDRAVSLPHLIFTQATYAVPPNRFFPLTRP